MGKLVVQKVPGMLELPDNVDVLNTFTDPEMSDKIKGYDGRYTGEVDIVWDSQFKTPNASSTTSKPFAASVFTVDTLTTVGEIEIGCYYYTNPGETIPSGKTVYMELRNWVGTGQPEENYTLVAESQLVASGGNYNTFVFDAPELVPGNYVIVVYRADGGNVNWRHAYGKSADTDIAYAPLGSSTKYGAISQNGLNTTSLAHDYQVRSSAKKDIVLTAEDVTGNLLIDGNPVASTSDLTITPTFTTQPSGTPYTIDTSVDYDFVTFESDNTIETGDLPPNTNVLESVITIDPAGFNITFDESIIADSYVPQDRVTRWLIEYLPLTSTTWGFKASVIDEV